MSILRSYIDKNNTIVSNSFVNTGRNPVIELNFGASDLVVPNFGYSRLLFNLDLSLLEQNIASGVISTGCTTGMTHTLKMTNTSSFDISYPEFIELENKDGELKNIGNSKYIASTNEGLVPPALWPCTYRLQLLRN
mgnify:CR=1 FL=1